MKRFFACELYKQLKVESAVNFQRNHGRNSLGDWGRHVPPNFLRWTECPPFHKFYKCPTRNGLIITHKKWEFWRLFARVTPLGATYFVNAMPDVTFINHCYDSPLTCLASFFNAEQGKWISWCTLIIFQLIALLRQDALCQYYVFTWVDLLKLLNWRAKCQICVNNCG